MENLGLHRFAVVLAVCTLFLVMAGAAVTSNQAGLSVPDWPLSYGQVMPEMTGGVRFEHGHRMVATTVGILTIGLAIWVWIADRRSWMRKLSLAALGAVIVQGVLGGLTVLLLLPPAVSISHACLAQLFFSTTVAMALFTSRSWQQGPDLVDDHGWPSLRALSIAAAALVLIQIALGASVRHRVMGVMPHVVGAMIVALGLLIVGAFVLHQFPSHKILRRAASLMLGATGLQMMLGLAAYLAGTDPSANPAALVVSSVAHVMGGALTLASSIALAILVQRNVRPPIAHSASEGPATVTS
jgi:cytochrome c oxidase assembly protein subunit 15